MREPKSAQAAISRRALQRVAPTSARTTSGVSARPEPATSKSRGPARERDQPADEETLA
jgi:hypothetical protein